MLGRKTASGDTTRTSSTDNKVVKRFRHQDNASHNV
jgi:hypothetical protein